MNKKANTVVFIIIATIFCTLVTISSFLLYLVIYTRFFFSSVPEYMLPWVLPILLFASLITSFLFYRAVVKIMIKKIDIDKYFEPIFKRRK